MDSCKSMRVDLLLRKFSKVDDVLMFVRNVNHAAFTNEQLKELSALAPDEKQVFVFKGFEEYEIRFLLIKSPKSARVFVFVFVFFYYCLD